MTWFNTNGSFGANGKSITPEGFSERFGDSKAPVRFRHEQHCSDPARAFRHMELFLETSPLSYSFDAMPDINDKLCSPCSWWNGSITAFLLVLSLCDLTSCFLQRTCHLGSNSSPCIIFQGLQLGSRLSLQRFDMFATVVALFQLLVAQKERHLAGFRILTHTPYLGKFA